jgi:choline kinase
MKYIILAAGLGKRLAPLTNNQPKCLFNVSQGYSIIQKMIDTIHFHDNCADILTVTGFKHDKMITNIRNTSFIYNPFYAVTNSISSLWFAKAYLNDEVTIINADIVMENNLIEEIVVNSYNESYVLIDSSIKVNGDYNVQVLNDNIIVMSKDLVNYYGEYAGVVKLSKYHAILLNYEIECMVIDGHYDTWYEDALVQLIFKDKLKLKYKDIKDYEWTEVDCVDDLIKAKSIHYKDNI